jgi:hypothetical protein
MAVAKESYTRFVFKWTFFAEGKRVKTPLEKCPVIHAIKLGSFGWPPPSGGWPEKVKGLARYVLSHSPNRANCPTPEAGSITPSGTHGPISINNL